MASDGEDANRDSAGRRANRRANQASQRAAKDLCDQADRKGKSDDERSLVTVFIGRQPSLTLHEEYRHSE